MAKMGILFYVACLLVITTQVGAYADFGKMFGANSGEQSSRPSTSPVNGDLCTDCEVRHSTPEQRKSYVSKNIARGQAMMDSCGSDHNKAEYKKGKVMKEIGEKELADLRAISPSPSDSSLYPERAAKPRPN